MTRMLLEGKQRFYRKFVVRECYHDVSSQIFGLLFLPEPLARFLLTYNERGSCAWILCSLLNASNEKLLTACLWRPQYRQDSPPGLLVPLRILRRPRGQDSLNALSQKIWIIIKVRGAIIHWYEEHTIIYSMHTIHTYNTIPYISSYTYNLTFYYSGKFHSFKCAMEILNIAIANTGLKIDRHNKTKQILTMKMETNEIK